ncbi:MAG: hypothetical protein FWD52_06360 [Candidatus Bathyarchaeota archaeon]|nr:hypothetical protein [Candidatus Termiticorpusculum sp.]
MTNDKLNIKTKFNLERFFSKKFLTIVSLLFMVVLVCSPIISTVNGESSVVSDVVVDSEAELLKAVEAAPNNEGYAIGLSKNIVLENPLKIPNNKIITLVSVDGFYNLTGKFPVHTIYVEGVLIIDTHLPKEAF